MPGSGEPEAVGAGKESSTPKSSQVLSLAMFPPVVGTVEPDGVAESSHC